MGSLRDQLLAQNFDAVLAVIVKLAGDPIFAKFCQDALYHLPRHPRNIHITGLHWGLETGMGWGCGGDKVGMVGLGAGNDSCGRDWQLKMPLFTFRLHFGSILGIF